MKYEPIASPGSTSEEETRGGDRHALEVIADVKIGWGQWQKARLQNVSATGFRIAWVPNGTQGADMRIRIPGLEPLAAKVRWRENSGLGCQFVNPLSVYVLEHIAKHAAR